MAGDKEDLDDMAILEAHARRTSCGVYLAVCLFGMAATLSANALWIMVPVSGKQVPENHRIAQYLVGLMELGNVSAMIFLLTRRCSSRGAVNEAPAIYLGLLVSAGAMAMLALFWEEKSAFVYGQYSMVYLAAAFGVSQVTCLAALTYLPFVARLKTTYITALFLGEALASLLPHTLAIGEGISTPPECEDTRRIYNSSYMIRRARFRPSTTLKPAVPMLRFNTSIYFFVMTGVLGLAGLCFLVLRCIPSVRFEYDQIQVDCMDEVELGNGGRSQSIEDEVDSAWHSGHTNSAVQRTPVKPVILDDGSIKQPFARTQQQGTNTNSPLGTPSKRQSNSHPRSRTVSNSTPQRSITIETKPSDSCMDLAPSFCLLMLITVWTSLFLYGPLSSVKAHTCLPIGNNTFLAGTLLTSLTPIVVIIIATRVTSDSKVTLVVAFTSLGTILLTYFVALIAFSHESESKEDSPIFQNNGELLTVSV